MGTLKIHKEQSIISDLFSDSQYYKNSNLILQLFYPITRNNYYKYPKKMLIQLSPNG